MNLIAEITKAFPNIEFVTQSDELEKYAHDESENLHFPNPIAALPKNTKEVSELVSYCNANNIAMFPRGAGTGLVGGSLTLQKGLIISTEKMNKIVNIDTENFTAQVEAGVINYQLQQALEEFQMFWPSDPSSWQSSLIGGNIATNAGGPRAVKYGVTRNWVLNLEVVLPNGAVIWTASNTLKNNTAYPLTQLLIGSEGTLGIITQAVLKLEYKPQFEFTMQVSFRNLKESAQAVAYLFQKGLQPSTLEFMDRNSLLQMQKYAPESIHQFNELTQAQLLI